MSNSFYCTIIKCSPTTEQHNISEAKKSQMNTQHVCNQTHLKHDESHDILPNQVGKDGGIGKMRPVVTGKGKDTTQPVYP
jgi:hypothetical protein